MSQEDVKDARRCWEKMVAGQMLEGDERELATERVWDPEAEYREDPKWPGAGIYRGRAEIAARFDEYRDLIGSQGVEIAIEDVIDAGDKIVSIIHARSQASRSGLSWEHRWGYVGSLRDGRWFELRAYYDSTEALEAVGLSE